MSIGECLVATLGLVSEPPRLHLPEDADCRAPASPIEGRSESLTTRRRHAARLLGGVLAAWLAPCGSSGGGVVNSTNEASLDEALKGGGEVVFTVNGSIPITTPKVISADTTLNGSGRQVILSGSLSNRLFEVNSNVLLTIVGITLARGSDTGADGADSAAGENGGHGEEGAGGAVYVGPGGRLHALSVVFATNSATGGAGGAGGGTSIGSLPGGQGGRAGPGRGGAIFSNGGKVRLTNCVLVANTAKGGDGGSGGDGGGGLNGGNGGDGGPGGNASGGAIHSTAGGIVQLINCALSENGAGGGIGGAGGWSGGGLGFDGANGSAGSGIGGAVFCGDGRLESLNCTFDHDRANGAHGWKGKPALRADPGENGRPGAGGSGGAVALSRGGAAITNCTFYANAANGGDGGDGGQGGTTGSGGDGGNGGSGGVASGGGIHNAGSTNLLVVNCTFASNVTAGGVGGEGGAPGTGVALPGRKGAAGQRHGGAMANSLGTVTLQNTLLADSSSGGNASGAFLDGGHNLSSDASPVFTEATSLGGTNAHLGTFAEHGGLTKTVALLAESPARDHGNAEAALATDQRGYARSGLPDIGAFELDGIPSPARLEIRRQGAQVVVSWPVEVTGYRLQRTPSLSLVNWTTVTDAVWEGQYWVVTNQSLGTSRFFRLVQ